VMNKTSLACAVLYDAAMNGRRVSDSSRARPAPAAHSFGLESGPLVSAISVLIAVMSVASEQTPTGNAGADVILTAALGVLFVWLATFARGWALLASSAIVLLLSAGQMPAVFIAAAAVASAVFMTMAIRLDRASWTIASAVTGALIGQAALNLPNYRWTGSASVFALAALIPLVISFFSTAPSWLRNRAAAAVGAIVLLCVLAAGLAVGAALSVRTPVETGVDQVRAGIRALEQADDAQAIALLEAAEQNFAMSQDRLAGPLTWPARVLPIVAQHTRAIDAATAEGEVLARTAVQTARAADVDAIRGVDGKIDLSTVTTVAVELENANAVLASSQVNLGQVRSDWLVPQLATRLDDVQLELNEARADIDLAAHATSVLPELLGESGSRTYLLLFLQPAEAREFGGFVAQYAELHVEDGALSVGRSGSSATFKSSQGVAEIADPESYPPPFFERAPNQFMSNLTGIADLSTIRQGAVEFWPQWVEDETSTLDGIVTLDPYAIAALLELSGPVFMPTWGESLTADNAVNFLLRDQYLIFDSQDAADQTERRNALNELVVGTLTQLLQGEIPGPEELGRVLGPVARSNRLAVSTNSDEENIFLDRVLLSADMPQVGTDADLLGVFTDQTRANKLDAYLTTSVNYVVDVDPETGEANGQADISISNVIFEGAPAYVAGGLVGLEDEAENLPDGVARNGVIVWSQQELVDLAAERAVPFDDPSFGQPVPAFGQYRQVVLTYAPPGTTTVTAQTTAQVPTGEYTLVVPSVQAANNGDITVTVRPAPGWRVNAPDAAIDGSWTASASMDTVNIFTVRFVRE